MEKEQETGRKKIVKKAAVIFLTTMLVLTFFSNTIMNYSLPEVASEPVMSGMVSNKVRGQGVVETNSEYEVTVSGSRVIKEVKVAVGDEVKEGQVLFTFDEGENSELAQAKAELEQMELDYAKSLLKMGPDYRSNNQEIEQAKEDLEQAIKVQEKAKSNSKNLAKAESDLKEANKNITDLKKQISDMGEVGDYKALEEQIKEVEKSIANAKVELSDLEEDLKMADADDESSKVSINRSIRDKKKQIEELEADLKAKKSSSGSLKTSNENLSKLQKNLAEWESKAEKLNADIEEMKALPSYEEAKKSVKEKRLNLENAQYNLKTKKDEDSITQQIESMDNQSAQAKIEEQKAKVEKLENSSDSKEIKAKESGIISQIDCKVGDNVQAETPLAKIQLSDSGYIVNITIPKEKSKLVKVGDEANVENIWDDGVKASVKAIRADTENPNQNMIIVFEVTGNVHPGENLAFSVGEKSNRYDTVVPNNAIREDSNGKFVLVIKQKSTPLGNRYKVKRASVDVMASDDNSSGVSGGVFEYEDVVTNSSKPLEDGMQVRLAK